MVPDSTANDSSCCACEWYGMEPAAWYTQQHGMSTNTAQPLQALLESQCGLLTAAKHDDVTCN